MEKEQVFKVVYKESNAHCVTNIEANWNTKSFSYPSTRWITYLDPAGMPSNKSSHIPSSGLSDHPRRCPSVSMSVNSSLLTIITSTTFISDVPSEKPMMLVL